MPSSQPHNGLPEGLLSQVRPTDVQDYARATGWERVQGVAGEIAVYHRPDSDTDEVIVPQNPTLDDYRRRIAEAVFVFSLLEQREPSAVLNDLLLPSSDTMRFRVESPETEDGAVPLVEGIDLLTGAKKALLASACDVLYPQTFHPRLSRTEAEQFIASCRLGQTERGSFIASILCPIDRTETQPSLFSELPAQTSEATTRRVTRHLMKALNRIAWSVQADTPERLFTFENEPIISANLYEAIAEMLPPIDRAALHVSASWARTVPPPSDVPQQVSIRREYVRFIETAVRRLRPKREPQRDHFVGVVDALSGEPDEDGRMQGTVTLAIFHPEDEAVVRARLDLSPPDYETACDAHKRAHLVEVFGVLHRAVRLHALRDYSDFRILKS